LTGVRRISAQRIILITGATGLIGRRLVEHFAQQGCRVRAGVRHPDQFQTRYNSVTAVKCDLPDHVDTKSFDGIDVCIHCAYTTRFSSLHEAHRTNIEGTRRVYDLAHKASVGRFVFLSSLSAHEQALSHYGRSKLEIEKMLDPKRDLILRPGVVLALGTGLFARMVDVIRTKRLIPLFAGGQQPVQTIALDDLIIAIDVALRENMTGRVTLAGPGRMTMRQLMDQIAQRLNKRVTYVSVPIAPALMALRCVERLKIQLPITSENLLGLKSMVHQEPDTTKLGLTLRTTAQSLDELFSDYGEAGRR